MPIFKQIVNAEAGVSQLSGSGTPEGAATGYIGQWYLDTSTNETYRKDSGHNTNTGWNLKAGSTSAGVIVMSIANSLTGALKFDGVSSYSKATYSAVYAGVPPSFDVDANNFYLPSPAGRALGVSGAGSGLTSQALFSFIGSEMHTLTEAELAAHTHPEPNAGAGGHYKTHFNGPGSSNNGTLQDGGSGSAPGLYNNTGSAGSGDAFSVEQPTLFVAQNLFIYHGL